MSLPCRRPAALNAAPVSRFSRVHGVMTDIDDTLTRDGAIEPAALQALQQLQAAGVPVVAITGRPLGWSQALAAHWPLHAVVAENGAVALVRESGGLQTEYAQDLQTRNHNLQRLQGVSAQILRQVPGATLAQDSAGRVTDMAIDHSEFVTLPTAAIDQVVALMQAAGMNATVSSIHINGWFGDHSKWSAAQWMVQRLFGRRLDDELSRWVYVGDSTNDQTMFERFPLSVGVANLQRFADQLTVWPAYITQGERGQGFAELVRVVLAARSPQGEARRAAE